MAGGRTIGHGLYSAPSFSLDSGTHSTGPKARRGDTVKCGNCGNDLMLGIVPKGPARLLQLLPMTPYRCVRCGKSNWRLSDAYGTLGSRLALGLLLLAALAGAYWSGATFGLPGATPANNEVSVTVEDTPGASMPEIVADGTPSATNDSSQPDRTAAQSTPPLPQPEPVQPSTPAPPVAAQPSPASTGGTQLDEVTVAPAPAKPASRPQVVAANKAAKGSSSKWSMRLKNITARKANGATVVTIQANATLDAPKSFALDGPPRYVVDIPGNWTEDSARSFKAAAGTVKAVRVGLREGSLRLVLDLKRSPGAPPVIEVREDALVITLR